MGRYQRKNGKMWEFFPSRDHPPSPQFGNPMFGKKFMVYFAFWDLKGTFLVFKEMFTFWVVLWLVEVGMDDPPPPPAGKIPTFSRFL